MFRRAATNYGRTVGTIHYDMYVCQGDVVVTLLWSCCGILRAPQRSSMRPFDQAAFLLLTFQAQGILSKGHSCCDGSRSAATHAPPFELFGAPSKLEPLRMDAPSVAHFQCGIDTGIINAYVVSASTPIIWLFWVS